MSKKGASMTWAPWSTAEIPGEERSSPQEADHSAKGQEGAEGDRRFPALSACGQQGNGHGASAPYANQDGQEGELPSKEGPDHGSELRVTPAHAPARRQEDDEYEGAATDQDAQQNVEPALRTAQQTEQGADDDARQRDDVGDDLVVQVDPADDHERGEEDHGRHEGENGHRAPGGHGEEKAGQELDGWVTPGDGSVAGAAPGAQGQPRHDRDVVVPADGGAAFRARGRWVHDAALHGQARDHDIEEAPDDEAEDQAHALEEEGRRHGVIVQDEPLR